jgi:DNA (cytosine-5)-methyltransferase 1
MTAYYNEIDPFAAAWLRELIKAGHIAPGDVDERSIVDVRPGDLRKYTQCHFFAGIGVWSYALRRAGWGDDRPIWTGSCPCQPFSKAGKGAGFADERHLWPSFFHLIGECSPSVVAGEQVASKDGLGWLDLVQADMEGTGYAFGAVDTCAAGVGAPHIRQRLYWLADSERFGRSGLLGDGGAELDSRDNRERSQSGLGFSRETGGVGDASHQSRERLTGSILGTEAPQHGTRLGVDGSLPVGLEHASAGMGRQQPGPINGLWRDADWLFCRDGKWRPVEPGTFPLAHGAAARVGRLRGYGNAINAEQATAFVEAYLEARSDHGSVQEGP